MGTKSPTKWDAQLTESNFQTRSSKTRQRLPAYRRRPLPSYIQDFISIKCISCV
ncbi:DUF6783 domain-containing protein [Enterocloster hominis]|uniref:DUF6783 domain-containing protein n=1 Tax=Enterocloster hominis (ex Hitch et al. 2024) TaxID=1917870 RepID=A0ABV1D8X7_9FIRM